MPNTTGTINVGDMVRLKGVQESAYRPQSLLDYLASNGLDETSAVFTVTDVFEGSKGTLVDFAELDTRGGYFLRRFEVVLPDPTGGPDIVGYSQAAVDALVSQARKDVVDELLGKLQEALDNLASVSQG